MPAPTERIALDVRQATPDDLDTVVALLRQAYDWLIGQGITDQRVRPFPPESIAPLIDHGEVYLAEHEGQPIATFTLTYTPDPELWNHPLHDAGYIRRLAVERRYAGHHIGGQLIDHAARLVVATDRNSLRLDCAKHNTRLHEYYRTQGFSNLRTIDLPHRESGALFERPAAPTLGE